MKVDLNCDMGEGYANDAALMRYVSSVNIACGFHAGDAATMKATVEMAIEMGVAIGAHPSFPDREGFGRRSMDLPFNVVKDIVIEQISTLRDICVSAGGRLRHVKPHGALYNQAAKDAALANTIAEAVRSIDKELTVFGLSGSFMISEAALCGLRTASEVFADRTYQSDGSLTPRSRPNALVTENDAAVEQVLTMVENQTVTAVDGKMVAIRADTICIHGDSEHALEFAKIIHDELISHGVEIRSIND